MKIEPAELAFDIDGVVADTMHLFLAIARSDFGINTARYEDIVDYDLRNCLDIPEDVMTEIILRIVGGGYGHPLRPIGDAARVISRLNDRHRPTLFVTARPEKEHIAGWLCENLDVSPDAITVVATGSFEKKREVLTENRIRYFVEDRLETCFLLAESGVAPIVFRQPWNRKSHPFAEVSGWDEIEAMVAM